MRNGVQLITYTDRLGGGDLAVIAALLRGPFEGMFTGVHILPFYTPFDGADAGFDPVDHRVVDPRLGTWEDIREISSTHNVTADLIVNHISDESPQFLDFVNHGADSPYAGMFLERAAVFPDGASPDEMDAIYRPRPGDPFTTVVMGDGSVRTLWTTFTAHQIDLDLRSIRAAEYIDEVLDRLVAAGVSQVRLDAVGYAMKTRGTSCFMTDDTLAFIQLLGAEVRKREMTSLLEIHSHHLDQIAVSEHVDRVYDFALPPLILHAMHAGDTRPLKEWLTVSPRNAVTVLDTHDGIGVIDVGENNGRPGLLNSQELDALVSAIDTATNGASTAATGESASNVDLYQLNTTYYSALGGDDDRYLLSRLIQFLSPGTPQVYYAGLLAQANDVDLLKETGIGRDINRPYLSPEDIDDALGRSVVRHLFDLIRFRTSHPAFDGSFQLLESDDRHLRIVWEASDASIEATIDVADATFELHSSLRGTTSVVSGWVDFQQASER